MSSFEDAAARKRALIEKAKQAAKAAKGELVQSTSHRVKIEFTDPEEATNKLRIFFDNSGSMADLIGDKEAVEHAKDGCVEFLRSCTPNKDAVAIHLLNNQPKYRSWNDDNARTFTIPQCILDSVLLTDLVSLATAIADESIGAVGGTPLFDRIREGQIAE